ncbi:MAG TPA: tetratricopeptide repeat protein [Pirellulales bacterium]|nr:tetratricopeptide repeat protein [Pirellulales bacterium]
MRNVWMMVAVLSLTCPASAAEGDARGDLRPQIERLLTLASEVSAKHMQETEHYYRSLRAASRSDWLLRYAYAVALIQQKRLHEAAKLIQELGEEHPDDFAVWRGKIWLALTLGERSRALTEIEQLASHAAAHQAAEAERLSEVEIAGFFGSVCGFLSGPWSQKVPAADAEQIEKRLRAAFDDKSRSAFDRAKAGVIDRFDALRAAYEEKEEKELQTNSQQLEAEKQSVGRAAQELGDKQQSIKDKETKRAEDAKAKVADIDEQLKKVGQQRDALLQQIAPLEAQRVALVAQLMPEGLFLPTRNLHLHAWQKVAARQFAALHNRQIRILLAPLVTKLTSLEGQVTSLNLQEQELFAARGTTQIKYQADVGKLVEKEKSLQKDAKRLAYDAKRLKSKSAASSPRLRAEMAHLTRFSTYVPFPFEREKARLLKEAKPPATDNP